MAEVALREAEKQALENLALRQQALALGQLALLAELVHMSEDDIARRSEEIRVADKARAKELRKGYEKAVRALGCIGIDAPAQSVAVTSDKDVLEGLAEPIEQPDDVVYVPSSNPESAEESLAEAKDEPLAAAETQTDHNVGEYSFVLSKPAAKLLGDFFGSDAPEVLHGDQDVEKWVDAILARTGEITMRKNKQGARPDARVRLRMLLNGAIYSQIAIYDRTTPGAIAQWFIKLRPKTPHSQKIIVAEPEAPVLDELATKIPPQPEQEKAAEQQELSPEDIRDELSVLLGLNEHETVVLNALLDPSMKPQDTPVNILVFEKIRDVIIATYGDSDINHASVSLTSQEVSVLRKFLGLFRGTNGKRDFKKPLPLAEMITEGKRNGSKDAAKFYPLALNGALAKLASDIRLQSGSEGQSAISARKAIEKDQQEPTWQELIKIAAFNHEHGKDNEKRRDWLNAAKLMYEKLGNQIGLTPEQTKLLWERMHTSEEKQQEQPSDEEKIILKQLYDFVKLSEDGIPDYQRRQLSRLLNPFGEKYITIVDMQHRLEKSSKNHGRFAADRLVADAFMRVMELTEKRRQS